MRPARVSVWWDFLAYCEFLGWDARRGGGVRLVRWGGALRSDSGSATARACVFSLLGGTFRSRFLFLAGAPAPALMFLSWPCLWGLVGWCVACRPGSIATRGVLNDGPESRPLGGRGGCGGFSSPSLLHRIITIL